MATVEIPLGNYTYRFRKLTYMEEFALKEMDGIAARRGILREALVNVSGLDIASRDDAARILSSVPDPVIDRVWMFYRTSLPEERFFSTRGLYRAPDPSAIAEKFAQAEDRKDEVVDRALASLEAKFGRQEVSEELAMQRRLVENAQKRGLAPEIPVNLGDEEED